MTHCFTGHRSPARAACWVLAAACGLLLGSLLTGCHRPYYRRQADAQAYGLIGEKIAPEAWPVGRIAIDTDPASRMFDPFDPDCPPMPPDDPTAHQYMHCVDGKRGYHGWHKQGDTLSVENPAWMSMLPLNEDGSLPLTIDSAVRLALVHSPVYQRALEELYLSALNVSFQRFRFDTQYFGGLSSFYDQGWNRSGSSSTLTLGGFSDARGSGLRGGRLFANGAEFLVGLANSVMWEFSGPNIRSATNLVDFAFFQPLLRNGGRDLVLEQLTQSERDLLANVRQMERFRRSFYVDVVAGRATEPAPSRGGLGLGGSLTGRTNTTGQAGGYLGLLQLKQDIRNQRSNISQLQSSVAQLQAFFQAGRIDFFQVELTRQALFNAQSGLLNSDRNLEAALDAYKLTLGLPPDLELKIDDSFLAPFQLLDQRIVPLQDQLSRIQLDVGEMMNDLWSGVVMPPSDPGAFGDLPAPPPQPGLDAPEGEAVAVPEVEGVAAAAPDAPGAAPRTLRTRQPRLMWSALTAEKVSALRGQLAAAETVLRQAREDNVPIARDDIQKLRDSMDTRFESAASLRRQLELRIGSERAWSDNRPITEADIAAIFPFDARRLRQLPQVLEDTLAEVLRQFDRSEQNLARYDRQLQQLLEEGPTLPPAELYDQLQAKILTAIPSEINRLTANVLVLSLVQARARTESITLPQIDLDEATAVQIARDHRLDWMNARASLVDNWRQVQVTANDLESSLDIVASGSIANAGDGLFDLRPAARDVRFGLEWDAPITRLIERNSYREALVQYQRARRDYYRFSDGVTLSLRDILRRLRINQINFELRRTAIEVAISQVELARLRLQEPPRPNEQAAFGATTARDLVSALSDLLSSQNNFVSVFVSQESLRRALDLDLGTMQLDPDGIWLDPGPISEPGALGTEQRTRRLPPAGAAPIDLGPAGAEAEAVPAPEADPPLVEGP